MGFWRIIILAFGVRHVNGYLTTAKRVQSKNNNEKQSNFPPYLPHCFVARCLGRVYDTKDRVLGWMEKLQKRNGKNTCFMNPKFPVQPCNHPTFYYFAGICSTKNSISLPWIEEKINSFLGFSFIFAIRLPIRKLAVCHNVIWLILSLSMWIRIMIFHNSFQCFLQLQKSFDDNNFLPFLSPNKLGFGRETFLCYRKKGNVYDSKRERNKNCETFHRTM